jgi:hypothetical protein
MVMHPEESGEMTRKIVEALKKQRPYAAYWEWPHKPSKEAGIMRDFLASWERAGFPRYEAVTALETDPPDFIAETSSGSRVGIELTELVSEEAIRANVNARRAGSEERTYRDWQPDAVLTVIQSNLDDKGAKQFHGGPYAEIHVVIHVDEPVIGAAEYRPRLDGSVFSRPLALTRAFVLFSYDPSEGGCPLVELRFKSAGP